MELTSLDARAAHIDRLSHFASELRVFLKIAR
jgi:hypothetical protein